MKSIANNTNIYMFVLYLLTRGEMSPREHSAPYAPLLGTDWATTLILENISDSLGDIKMVKTQ